MPNIEELTQFMTSTPDEAAKNINNSRVFSMDPGAYKSFAPQLDPQVDQIEKTVPATPAVDAYRTQSTEHAALTAPDVEHLSWIEKQAHLIGDYMFDRPNADSKSVEMNLRKMNNPDAWTADDELKLQMVNEDRKTLSSQNYGLDGPIEQLPAKAAGFAAGFVRDTAQGALEGISERTGVSSTGPGSLAPKMMFGVARRMFRNLTGATFNELPEDMDPQLKKHIAQGVGVVGAAIQSVVPMGIGRTVPLLSKFMNPGLAAKLVTSPLSAAISKTVMNIGESSAILGLAGTGVEATKIVGEELAKIDNPDDATVLNALTNAANNLDKHKARLIDAGLTGAATGFGISAVSGVMGFGATKSRFESYADRFQAVEENRATNARDVTPETPKQLESPLKPNETRDVTPQTPEGGGSPEVQADNVINFEEAMKNMARVAKQTGMAETAPAELDNVKQRIFEKAGIKWVYALPDNIKQWVADDGKRADRVKEWTGMAPNTPVKIPTHQFAALVRDYPDATNFVQVTPDGPTPVQAKQHVENMNAADEKRQEILKKLGAGELTETEAKVLSAAVDVEAMKSLDHDEQTWLPTVATAEHNAIIQPTFTDAIAKMLPEAEVRKYNEAQGRARADHVDILKESANLEMDKVRDIEVEAGLEIQKEIEDARIENDPAFAVVDKFHRDRVADGKGKKALSQYVIDPRSLTDSQLKKYLDNPMLKEHKAFGKPGEGMSPDEAAKELGVVDGDSLLQLLASTPRREKITELRTLANKPSIEKQVDENLELNKTALIKALDDRTLQALETMKFMRQQEWPATKSGIKRIALPLPSSKELETQARGAIAHSKVGDLNVQQFVVGERQSKRLAVNSILKNQVETAFKAKEAEALNIQLQKATHLAVGEVNRVFRFAKKFNDKSVMNELKSAGSIYLNAANEILDVFKLSPSKAGLSEQGSFAKFVKAQVEAGQGNFEIPERFTDIRQSANEMTVEAVKLVGDRLKAVLHLARLKNRLYTEFRKKSILQTKEAIAEAIHEQLVTHPDYHPNRVPETQEAHPFQKAMSWAADGASMLDAFKHIAMTLDQEKPLGFFYELLVEPLTGEGKYKYVQGYSRDIQDRAELLHHLEKNVKELGTTEYRDLRNTWLEIPEFREFSKLNNGKIVKADLLIMMAHLGQEDGLKALQDLGPSIETIKSVLDRELTEKHANFVQNFMLDGYKNYWERTLQLEKETSGRDVTMIQPVEWEHRGKVRPGGYSRIRRRVDFDKEQIKNTLQELENKEAAMFGDKDAKFYQRQHAAEMTEQGRLEERTGSSKALDISFGQIMRNYEEIIHDLNYRKPVIDGLKILNDDGVRADIMAAIGPQKYRILVNTYTNVAGQMEAENRNYFADQTRFAKDLTGQVRSGFSIARIGANAVSMAVQPASVILNTLPKMGMLNGTKHISAILANILRHPFHYHEMIKLSAELEASINAEHNEIADSITSTFYGALPSQNKFPTLAPLARANQAVSKMAMALVQQVDTFFKGVVSRAAYRAFTAGDVEGYPIDKVKKMSLAEIHEKASRYAAQISETTLTRGHEALDKNAFQRNPRMDFFNYFMNDARQTINSQMSQGRQIKWKLRDLNDTLGEGSGKKGGVDFSGSKNAAYGAAATIMTLLVSNALARLYEDSVRGYPTPLGYKDQFDLNTAQGQAQAAHEFGKWFLLATPDMDAMSIPFVREIHYAADVGNSRKSKKDVSIPVTQVLTAVATTYNTLGELLSLDRENMDKAQTEQALYALSYISGSIPVSGPKKFMKWLENNETIQKIFQPSAVDNLHKEIQEYKKDHSADVPKEFLEKLEKLDQQLKPADVAEQIPKDFYSKMANAESGGKWSFKNSGSDKAGVYQFSESSWKNIMKSAPDLGLTENGRLAKDGFEQDMAVRWETKNNAQQLGAKEIPIKSETLYGAHQFGVDVYSKIYKAPRDAKLKTIVGSKFFEENPKFSKFKTVGQVKDELSGRLVEAQKGDNKLTLDTATTED